MHPPADYFTDENVERYLEAAERRGYRRARRLRARPPLHASARALGPPVLARAGARRPRRLLRVRPLDPAAPRDRDGLRARARGPDRDAARRAMTSTTWSAPSTSSATRPSIGTSATSGTQSRTRTASGSRYFDTLAEAVRTGLFDILAHPDLVKVWGPERRGPSATRASTTSRRSRRSPRRGIAVEVSTAGCASRSAELYPSRAFAEMCVDAGAAVRALLRRPRARARRLRVRARGGDAAASGA